MILNDLILPLISCAREAVNDFRSHSNNRADGVKNKVGYIVIEITSDPIDFDVSLVFDHVNSALRHRDCICVWCGFDPTLWWGLSFNLSRASPLNFSCNFGLLQSRLFKSSVVLGEVVAKLVY